MDVSEFRRHIKSMTGLKFRPSDQILVENYLYCKIHNLDYFRDNVFDYDLYGTAEPWQIWELFEGVDGEDLYFFTQLKRSTTKSGQSSSHVNRKVGSAGGTWSAENSLTPVFATHDDDEVIGYCRRLRYENPQMPEHHGEWIMHEYSLHEKFIQDNNPCSNYVLCRIRKNERVKRKAVKIMRVMALMESNERCNKTVKEQSQSLMAPAWEQCQSLMAPVIEQSMAPAWEQSQNLMAPVIEQSMTPAWEQSENLIAPVSEQSLMAPVSEQSMASTWEQSQSLLAPFSKQSMAPAWEQSQNLMAPVSEQSLVAPTWKQSQSLMAPFSEQSLVAPTWEQSQNLMAPFSEQSLVAPTWEQSQSLMAPVGEQSITAPVSEQSLMASASEQSQSLMEPTWEEILMAPANEQSLIALMSEQSWMAPAYKQSDIEPHLQTIEDLERWIFQDM